MNKVEEGILRIFIMGKVTKRKKEIMTYLHELQVISGLSDYKGVREEEGMIRLDDRGRQ